MGVYGVSETYQAPNDGSVANDEQVFLTSLQLENDGFDADYISSSGKAKLTREVVV